MSVKEILEKVKRENVVFSKHSVENLLDRKIDTNFVLEKLFDFDNLEAESKQNGTHVLVYSLSSKYKLVIVISFENGVVKIVTAFKSSKRVEKLLKRSKGIIVYSKIVNL